MLGGAPLPPRPFDEKQGISPQGLLATPPHRLCLDQMRRGLQHRPDPQLVWTQQRLQTFVALGPTGEPMASAEHLRLAATGVDQREGGRAAEEVGRLGDFLDAVRSHGKRSGLSLMIHESLDLLDPYWERLDVVTLVACRSAAR